MTTPSFNEVMADQLRLPRGPLAPFTARLLNHRNQALIERAVAALDVHPGQRVLDVGFGGGLSLQLLVEGAAGQVCGIEPSQEMVRRARRALAPDVSAGRVVVEVAPVDHIPFGAGHFHRVVSVQTVYFWSDLRRGLDEVARVMVHGGRLVLAMMVRPVQELYGFAERGYHVLGEEELAPLLWEAGFEDVSWCRRAGATVVVAARP